MRRRTAFTLVELLVVIGIIALLISVLLPALNSARKQADRVKCLSGMRQLGNAYFLYANENKGMWPVARHTWNHTGPSPVGWLSRDKRWHDYIGKFVVGDKVGKQEINFDGTQSSAYQPQIWSPEIRFGNNVLWGCPQWQRYTKVGASVTLGSIYHPGYAMNPYPFAPNDLNAAGTGVDGQKDVSVSGMPITNQGFFRQSQWKRAAERCLIAESVHGNLNLWSGVVTWPYQPDTSTPFPDRPDGGSFALDFDRHGKRPMGNRPNDPSMNMLFCDGHADTVSAREGWRAIRFR